MKFAAFMHKVRQHQGTRRPSWKDMFFPEIGDLKGS